MVEFKQKEKEAEQEDFEAGFKIPDTKGILGDLEDAEKAELYQEHLDLTQEEEKAEKQGKAVKRRQKPKGGTICFCGNPTCRIGEFVEIRGE